MAERVEMSFKNKEVKMWFLIMIPFFVIGSLVLFFGDQSTRYLPFLLIMAAWAIYYSWRYRYRKKRRNSAENTK